MHSLLHKNNILILVKLLLMLPKGKNKVKIKSNPYFINNEEFYLRDWIPHSDHPIKQQNKTNRRHKRDKEPEIIRTKKISSSVIKKLINFLIQY